MLDNANKDYLIGIISNVTGIKKEDLNDIKVQNVEHIVNNKKDKKMRSDIIVSIGNNIINSIILIVLRKIKRYINLYIWKKILI